MGDKKQPSEKQINFAKSLGIENPEKYDMTTLSGMIEAETGGSKEKTIDPSANEKPVVETVKIGGSERDHKYDKDPTGLAVEIFNVMVNKVESIKVEEATILMTHSIALVKQAQEAFK